MYVYSILSVLNGQPNLMNLERPEVNGLPKLLVSVCNTLCGCLTDSLVIDDLPPHIDFPAVNLDYTGVLHCGIQKEVGGYRPVIPGCGVEDEDLRRPSVVLVPVYLVLNLHLDDSIGSKAGLVHTEGVHRIQPVFCELDGNLRSVRGEDGYRLPSISWVHAEEDALAVVCRRREVERY